MRAWAREYPFPLTARLVRPQCISNAVQQDPGLLREQVRRFKDDVDGFDLKGVHRAVLEPLDLVSEEP